SSLESPLTHFHTLPLHAALPISLTRHNDCDISLSTIFRMPPRPSTGWSNSLAPTATFSSPLIRTRPSKASAVHVRKNWCTGPRRSEEHTSELQSRFDLVCRLLLE